MVKTITDWGQRSDQRTSFVNDACQSQHANRTYLVCFAIWDYSLHY